MKNSKKKKMWKLQAETRYEHFSQTKNANKIFPIII